METDEHYKLLLNALIGARTTEEVELIQKKLELLYEVHHTVG